MNTNKRRRISKDYSSAATTPAAASMRRIAEAVVRRSQEVKLASFTASTRTSIGSTFGTLTNLASIAQGTGDADRVGNRITVKKLFVHKSITIPDGSAGDTVRFILLQSRGRELTSSDMPSVFAPADLDKFRVLYDRFIGIHPNYHDGTNPGGGSEVEVRFSVPAKKLLQKKLQYNDTVTAPDYPIYLYMIDANNTATQAGFEQIYYYDA